MVGCIVAASLFLWFPSVLEAANEGRSRWSFSVVNGFFWMQVLIVVGCCVVGLGKSAANLAYGQRWLPNAIAIVLLLPIFLVLIVFWQKVSA